MSCRHLPSFAFIILFVVVSTGRSHAAGCWRLTADEFLRSGNVVFVGRLIRSDNSRASFEIVESWKGRLASPVKISLQGSESGRAFHFVDSRSYLISTSTNGDDLATNRCSVLDQAEIDAHRSALNDFRKARDILRAEVVNRPSEAEPLLALARHLDEYGEADDASRIYLQAISLRKQIPGSPEPRMHGLPVDPSAQAPEVIRGRPVSSSQFAGKTLRADAAGAEMPHSDLAGAKIFGGTFAGADLSGSDLSQAIVNADLSRTNLSEIHAQGATFESASATQARFVGADLRNAKFQLKGGGPIFVGADLSGAKLDGINLADADFSGADLSDATFSKATYNCATRWPQGFNPRRVGAVELPDRTHCKDAPPIDYTGSDLSGMNLGYLDFRNAVFKWAKLRGTSFAGADLEGADFEGATEIDLDQFKSARLSRATFRNATVRVDLAWPPPNIREVDFRGARLSFERREKNAPTSPALLRMLDAAQTRGAVIGCPDNPTIELLEPSRRGMLLTTSQCEGRQPTRADLSGLDLSGIDLTAVDLRGADLRRSNLEGTNLHDVLYDADTKWPTEFDPAKAGAVSADAAPKTWGDLVPSSWRDRLRRNP